MKVPLSEDTKRLLDLIRKTVDVLEKYDDGNRGIAIVVSSGKQILKEYEDKLKE